jgi:hypothetical protein
MNGGEPVSGGFGLETPPSASTAIRKQGLGNQDGETDETGYAGA